ncbi:hypothetical protein Amsp01_007090 [Amycolatopsis sp. NBRC 101858]|uniref:hypothetical protein n=1 Tax=Amycolatopsis sp. NBRC 101858 TaxID=3032200 RepID=UPI0024A2CD88|nr:hypothetical protein [Amycolatopsis sp. NBRC 101858]GLY34685.1 hypothetical protein Amsp01_007090 [Amycolatopsis sp. NBRC 101858]
MTDERDDVAAEERDRAGVDAVLFPGEHVLWSGRPRRHPLHIEEWLWLGVALVWAALMSLIFTASLVRHNPMAYFVLPMPVVGFLPPAGLIFVRQRMARSTRYFLTTLRVLAIHERPWYRVRWEYLAQVPAPVVRIGRAGTGTLSFGWPDPIARIGAFFSPPAWGPPPDGALSLRRVEFRGIEDFEQVRDLIVRAQGPR